MALKSLLAIQVSVAKSRQPFSTLLARFSSLEKGILKTNTANQQKVNIEQTDDPALLLLDLGLLARGARAFVNGEEVTLSWRDKLGLLIYFLGESLLLSYLKVIDSVDINTDTGEISLRESVLATVMGRLIYFINNNALKTVIKLPNISGFGLFMTLAASKILMDAGVALLSDTLNPLKDSYKNLISDKISQFFDICLRQVNETYPVTARFLAKVVSFVHRSYNLFISSVNAIKNLFSRTQNESHIIQESIIGRIVTRILSGSLIITVLALAFKFLSDLTGNNVLQKLANANTPLKPLFRKLVNVSDQLELKVKPIFDELRKRSTKQGLNIQNNEELTA